MKVYIVTAYTLTEDYKQIESSRPVAKYATEVQAEWHCEAVTKRFARCARANPGAKYARVLHGYREVTEGGEIAFVDADGDEVTAR